MSAATTKIHSLKLAVDNHSAEDAKETGLLSGGGSFAYATLRREGRRGQLYSACRGARETEGGAEVASARAIRAALHGAGFVVFAGTERVSVLEETSRKPVRFDAESEALLARYLRALAPPPPAAPSRAPEPSAPSGSGGSSLPGPLPRPRAGARPAGRCVSGEAKLLVDRL